MMKSCLSLLAAALFSAFLPLSAAAEPRTERILFDAEVFGAVSQLCRSADPRGRHAAQQHRHLYDGQQ